MGTSRPTGGGVLLLAPAGALRIAGQSITRFGGLSGVCLGPDPSNKSWWAVGNGVILHATGDSPSTWTQQGAAVTGSANLVGCVASDATHGWAFGGNGAAFVTSDGVTWAPIAMPLPTTVIHAYALVNGRPPAEADMQRFFGVTPPSVHNMVKTLERLGLITRAPRQARSIAVALPEDQLPRLRQPIKSSASEY